MDFTSKFIKCVYVGVIVFAVYEIVYGSAEVGVIMLYTGYITQTQGVLNTLSNLYDRIADVNIGLKRISDEGDVEVHHLMEHISQEPTQ